MIYLILALSIFLVAALAFCHHLRLRCIVAEQKISSQEELKQAFEHYAQLSYLEAQEKLYEKSLVEDETKRKVLSDMLSKLERQMQKIELDRKTDQGTLKEQLRSLVEAEQQLRSETSRLTRALRSPAGRGRWGELQLRRVVELSGMLEHCDFVEQPMDVSAGVRRKPDLIVKLPGDRQVIVDSKVPLEAYLEAIEQQVESQQEEKLKLHARHLKDHIQALARKSYWHYFEATPEFVVLFLPSETIFAAALEKDPTLMEMAAEHGIILATPMTLIALLKAVAYGWKQEHMSQHAKKIAELGQGLYKHVSDLASHWGFLSKSLEQAVKAFNQATSSLERNVLSSARKFQDLGAASSLDPIEEISLIDETPRQTASDKLNSS